MAWQDQGRQYHGWFGDGTGVSSLFKAESFKQRIEATAYGAVAALPADRRAKASAQLAAGGLAKLTDLMTAWTHGAKLDREAFARQFFGRSADDPTASNLRMASQEAAVAEDHADLRQASDRLAGAMQAIGLDRWPSFLADAETRIDTRKTIAGVGKAIGAASPVPAGTATNEQNSNQLITSDDFQRRQQIASSLVRFGGSASSTDATRVAEHLSTLMTRSQLQKLKSAGIRIVAARGSVTDYLTPLKGVRPRGYLPGLTWDTVAGTVSGKNEVVVATHTALNGERELPGVQQSSSADVTLHEIGHAINRQLASGLASDKEDFKQAYDEDTGKGPLAEAYYHQKDTAAGRDEAFAESHAEFLTAPAKMQEQYPNSYAYWTHYYGAEK